MLTARLRRNGLLSPDADDIRDDGYVPPITAEVLKP
jgi:hypothetical protein